MSRLAVGQTYPLLEEINRQTQSLYQDVQGGVVRVQLPVPKWVREAAEQDDPLAKWGDVVGPDVKRTLEERKDRQLRGKGGRLETEIRPAAKGVSATRPTTRISTGAGNATVPAGWRVTQSATGETILESTGTGGQSIVIHNSEDAVEPRDAPNALGGVLRPRGAAAGEFAPNNLGILIDDEGHVLVPLFIERETLEGEAVRVMIQDRALTATFVGSDEKTNLTILKLDEAGVGRPVKMGIGKPSEGSLVMVLNPSSAVGRLSLWTGGEKEYGVIVSMDGSIAGIARYGQFLGGNAYRFVVEQLIERGSIQRATLGTRLTEVRKDDPMRRGMPGLADRPALLCEQVQANSAAQKAGLREGDLILQLGDEPVGDLTTWAALTARRGTLTVHVLREGRRERVQMELERGE